MPILTCTCTRTCWIYPSIMNYQATLTISQHLSNVHIHVHHTHHVHVHLHTQLIHVHVHVVILYSALHPVLHPTHQVLSPTSTCTHQPPPEVLLYHHGSSTCPSCMPHLLVQPSGFPAIEVLCYDTHCPHLLLLVDPSP